MDIEWNNCIRSFLILNRAGSAPGNGPLSDYAEHLVHKHYGGERNQNNGKGWDVQASNGERIQVKSTWLKQRKNWDGKEPGFIPVGDKKYSVVWIVFGRELNIRNVFYLPIELLHQFAKPYKIGWRIPRSDQAFLESPLLQRPAMFDPRSDF